MPQNLPMNAVLRDFGACTVVRGVKSLKRELLHGNQGKGILDRSSSFQELQIAATLDVI
jgi:hypothetical protein